MEAALAFTPVVRGNGGDCHHPSNAEWLLQTRSPAQKTCTSMIFEKELKT